jgi:hypothetical protein
MSNDQIFERFAKVLEDSYGTPAGRTEKEVQDFIRGKYKSVFDAIELFCAKVKYQNNVFKIEERVNKTDIKRYVLNVTAVVHHGQETGLTFNLKRDEITTENPYIIKASGLGTDRWPANQQEDFIKVLSKAILDVFGC